MNRKIQTCYPLDEKEKAKLRLAAIQAQLKGKTETNALLSQAAQKPLPEPKPAKRHAKQQTPAAGNLVMRLGSMKADSTKMAPASHVIKSGQTDSTEPSGLVRWLIICTVAFAILAAACIVIMPIMTNWVSLSETTKTENTTAEKAAEITTTEVTATVTTTLSDENVRDDEIRQIISEANDLAQNQQDYWHAYLMLSEAAQRYDDDVRLLYAAKTMRDNYTQEKISAADYLVSFGQYDDAIELLELSVAEISGIKEIEEKLDALYDAREQSQSTNSSEPSTIFSIPGDSNSAIFQNDGQWYSWKWKDENDHGKGVQSVTWRITVSGRTTAPVYITVEKNAVVNGTIKDPQGVFAGFEKEKLALKANIEPILTEILIRTRDELADPNFSITRLANGTAPVSNHFVTQYYTDWIKTAQVKALDDANLFLKQYILGK